MVYHTTLIIDHCTKILPQFKREILICVACPRSREYITRAQTEYVQKNQVKG